MVSDESLRKYLLSNYRYEDGWLIRLHDYKQWKAGTKVGAMGRRGYRTLYLLGKRYYVHRLIFLMHHGYMPPLVDHEDWDKDNNKIDNLRDATKIENALNISGPHTDNKSGFLGVFFRSDTKKYVAKFRQETIGYFTNPEEAHAAYLKFRADAGAPARQAERAFC